MVVTWDPVAFVITAAAAAGAALINKVYGFFKNRLLERRQLEIRELADHLAQNTIAGYINKESMSRYDQKMAESTKQILKDVLGEMPVEALHALNNEERIQKTSEVVEEILKLYNVHLDGVVICELDSATAGYYNREKNTIALNSQFLLSADITCIREFLDTVLHECRHVIQFRAIENIDSVTENTSENFWQLEKDRVLRWCRFHQDYQEAVKNPLEYYMNVLEIDARTFAYMCLEGVE